MKFKFAKSLLLGSIFALGSLGLTACGGDSSSSAEEESSSSGAQPLILSSVSETSPLDKGSNISANATADGQGGYELSLSGIIKTDNDEFDTEGYDGDDRVYYNIDSLQFDIGDKDGNRVNLPVPINPGVFGNNADRGINLVTAINGEIKLNQDAIGCGEFTLYVTIFMSGDEEDTKQFQYSARMETKFNLQCKVIESSSAAATCTEMEVAGEVVLSNILGSDQSALNFSTGTTENPDVTLSIVDRIPYFQASAGVKIIQEGSQESGVIPTAPICLENFTEAYNGEHNPMELEDMAWYLVVTPTGTYPFMRGSFLAQDDAKGKVTITYLKKK
jgi:hypothetical protein